MTNWRGSVGCTKPDTTVGDQGGTVQSEPVDDGSQIAEVKSQEYATDPMDATGPDEH